MYVCLWVRVCSTRARVCVCMCEHGPSGKAEGVGVSAKKKKKKKKMLQAQITFKRARESNSHIKINRQISTSINHNSNNQKEKPQNKRTTKIPKDAVWVVALLKNGEVLRKTTPSELNRNKQNVSLHGWLNLLQLVSRVSTQNGNIQAHTQATLLSQSRVNLS